MVTGNKCSKQSSVLTHYLAQAPHKLRKFIGYYVTFYKLPKPVGQSFQNPEKKQNLSSRHPDSVVWLGSIIKTLF